MPVCETCGDAISGNEDIRCPECYFHYCRDHYHGHECEPIEEIETPESIERIGSGLLMVTATFGYLLTVLFAGLGTIHLLRSIEVVVVGGEAIDTVQALADFVIIGGLFSVATFLVVVSYILMKHAEDSGGTSDD